MAACAYCHRADCMQAGLSHYQCLACGQLTNADGTPGTATVEVRTIVPVIEYPEPESQHPDRRRRPGDADPEVMEVEAAPEPAAAPEPEPTETVNWWRS